MRLRAWLIENRYDEAIEKYKRGVEIDPKMADLHASLGHTYKVDRLPLILPHSADWLVL